jgi:starch synthase
VRVALLTREFPPEVYGGAGVHVEHLAPELAHLVDVEVHCFGAKRESSLVRAAYPYPAPDFPSDANAALKVMDTDLRMAAGVGPVDLVHSHTWYTNLAGHLTKLLHGIPHVMTVHSLEPLRPWKADQLGAGYGLSRLCERVGIEAADAVIAVSEAMAGDVSEAYPAVDRSRVRVVHNGIDPDVYRPDPGTDVLERIGIDPADPYVMWIGRVTPQKGVGYLLDMAALLPSGVQLVLLAGASDTPEYGREMAFRAAAIAARRVGLNWIETIFPRPDVVQLLSHAALFVCPSQYEPFGLINLEAMACGVPVVATTVGGIPEIVVDGETGFLVPLSPETPHFLAEAALTLLGDADLRRRMGAAGRERVLERFTWKAIAARTAEVYASLT